MTSNLVSEVLNAHVSYTTFTTALASTRFNAPALTTVFTYASTCQDRWVLEQNQPFSIFSTSPDGFSNSGDPLWTSCQPWNFQSSYSPGVRPAGHTLGTVSGAKYIWSSNTASEWTGLCCPVGMSPTARGFDCYSKFSTPLQVFALITSSYRVVDIRSDPEPESLVTLKEYFFTMPYLDTISGSITTIFSLLSNVTTITTGTAEARGLLVYWQSSDLPNFPPAYASSIAKQIGVPFTATPTPGSSSTLPQQTGSLPLQPNPASSGLSTGAKAGVGVGAALGFFLLLLLTILSILFLHRRRSRKRSSANFSPTRHAILEMEDQDAALATRKWYLGGRWRSEVECKPEPGELDSRNIRVVPGPPVELDAGERRGHNEAVGGVKPR